MTANPPPGPADILILNRSDVRGLLMWPDLLTAARAGLIAIADPGSGAPSAAAQVHVPGAVLHLKAGAVPEPPVLSVKANLRPDRGGASGALLVFDHHTQRLEAVMASADLTAMRTAAVAAVAAGALLRVAEPVVAILGAGPVAEHVHAVLSHITAPREIRVWSRDPSRAERLNHASHGGSHRTAPTPAAAVAGADLIITCTPARRPLLERGDLTGPAVILAMGADSPGKRELAAGILDAADVLVDTPLDPTRPGECAHRDPAFGPPPTVLGRLLTGGEHRRAGGRLTVFDSVGSAVIDAAVAAMVLHRARSAGIGSPAAWDS